MFMQIDFLADHPEFIPTLARWHHAEWGYLHPGDTLEARTARLRGECGYTEIPTTVIAFNGGTLLGSAMLIAHDMDTRMDLSPWLASVFVAPERRGEGIGTTLVQRVVSEAKALDVPRLFLYTPTAASFYSRLGWSVVEQTTYRETAVVVMAYDTKS
jgi:N-acetylglutamate synthase-like GNAT family acetyltransferase